jgi:hypothetical protein
MPVLQHYPNPVRFAIVATILLAASLGLSAQPPEPGKKLDPTKSGPVEPAIDSSRVPSGIRLPDGTFLWTGPRNGAGERVVLTPEELQKLQAQVEDLKKQLAARKPSPPSSCAIRSKVEKRGDVLVAATRVTYSFRTLAPNTAVALGARRSFLVAATLDGNKLPILDTGEDGFAAMIEASGDHTLALDLESPVGVRGTSKTEIGFELGLPRAAITTFTLVPPSSVKRVNLSTRTPDPGPMAKPPEIRRVPGLDVKHLTPGSSSEGYALGPIDLLEVAWEPPAAAPAPDAVQSAVTDVTCLLAEGFIETTARILPRGPARIWRIAAPADCMLTVDRAVTSVPVAEPGMIDLPTVTRPAEPGKPVWTVEFPVGTSASDWVITALHRVSRPKPGDARHSGPFAIGPFTVLEVSRQTGTVRISAAANTHLSFRHGPDLRQSELPVAVDDETAALFRFATGPTGSTPPQAPLMQFEARPLAGTVQIRPTYRLTLTESGWRVRAELKVSPIRTAIDTVTIELPADWRGSGVTPPELVEAAQQVKSGGTSQVLAVRLAAMQKQPFDLVLTAALPVAASAREAVLELPRFPGAAERDPAIQISVPTSLEVRGVVREWDGDRPAGWVKALLPAPAADGRPTRAVTAIAGKFENAVARVELAWAPYRPELTAQVQADVTVQDGQIHVLERVQLHAPDGFDRPVRFQGIEAARGLKAAPALDLTDPAEWAATFASDQKDVTIQLEYALPAPAQAGPGPWQWPVGLVWPLGITRTESLVRVWAGTAAARVAGAGEGSWRMLPPEPVVGRESLPVLSLAGFGDELPLTLRMAEADSAHAVAVWVDRGLLQVWMADDGTAGCRARFLLSRWLNDSIEFRLPDSLGSTLPDVLIDGRRAEPLAGATGAARAVRVRLPRAESARTVVVELRYLLNLGDTESGVLFMPPWPDAAATGPVRWQVTAPPGQIPLLLGGRRIEQTWGFHRGLLQPAGTSTDALERWFQSGAEPGGGAGALESVTVRLAGSESIRLVHVPRLGLVVACSIALLIAGLIILRLPAGLSGVLVALFGGALAAAGILFPQPAGQIAAAALPGLVALILVMGSMAAVRWYQRRRITYLPGFARGRGEPSLAPAAGGIPSSRRVPALPAGSTGPHENPIPSSPHSATSSAAR